MKVPSLAKMQMVETLLWSGVGVLMLAQGSIWLYRKIQEKRSAP